jgi:hypothetical protein
MLMLSFILGAAVVHFRLPTSDFLMDAFQGGRALYEQKLELADADEPTKLTPAGIAVDKPDKTFDGFTLYSTTTGGEARLLNMRGEVIHKWDRRFSRIWPRAPHVRNPVEDDKIYFFACHLYPNGDLLVVFHGTGDTPYGYGLAKLDKDSNVVWTYSANAHHDVNVGEDGTIYALTQEIVREMPPGLKDLPTPALVDSLVVLSPEGKEQKKIPLLEALRDSPYALFLPSRETILEKEWDVLHANHCEVLTSAMAKHFPMFKAGQVLVSLRELDAIAVVDPDTRAVVWAAKGPWRGQHDPHFLDNGRLMVFDNRGAGIDSRVLEYDLRTQAYPWTYTKENSDAFYTRIQGRCQRLANGNTLIVNSRDGVLLEVSPSKELVWSCSCQCKVPWARRYAPEQLTFVKGIHYARP